jgi:hypothetical protein
MLTVHLRVNDAATGKPTPVRLQVTGPDGTFYAPLGRSAEFPTGRGEAVGGHLRLGREKWVYTDGSCEVKLPAGVPLRVRATKGPEYGPLDQTVTLGPGQMALRFAVERRSELATDGWVSGDTRCHFLAPHAALLEAAAEDLDVVNLLAVVHPVASLDGTAYPLAPDLLAFSGQAPALESHGRLVAVNTLNAHPVLGKVGLLYSHRPVFPLAFGGDEDTDDWSVCDWCDQCHRKGGLVVWVDAFRQGVGPVGGEALAAAVLGKVDAIEFVGDPKQQAFLPWVYGLWDAGFPIPLAGGSGKDSNRVPLGCPRTYANVLPSPDREAGGALTGAPSSPGTPYKAWVEAVRAGRTFVTNGPVVRLDVASRGPGDTVDAAGPHPVRASAASLTRFDKLELVAAGAVIAAAGATNSGPGGVWTAELEVPHAPTESGWVAARCIGGFDPLLPPGVLVFAHTSPVWVRVGGKPSARRKAALAPIRQAVEQTREWVETQGRFASPRAKQHLLDLCDAALERLS